MKRLIKTTAVCSVLAAFLFTIVYHTTANGICLSLAITAGTISYHFVMRLVIGGLFRKFMHNTADLSRQWYQQKHWEKKLYQVLKVKRWKQWMPTYEPDFFDLRKHSPVEIAGAMCQAEVSHEVIVGLSFLPLAVVPLFGAFWVFLITSVASAVFDLLFAVMQRYNRPRVMRMVKAGSIIKK